MNAIISVESLRYHYPAKSDDTIRDISFAIESGEIFGFLGPSGSGKSTTQKLLIGLLNNYRGTMELLGKDQKDWDHSFYQHIGVGFELPNHFLKLTGLENLQLFASFYGSNTPSPDCLSPQQLLELVDLTESANQRVSEYSKGMKMRLNFARALLNDPQLLFLDEPTAGLDPVTSRKIKDIIKDLQKKGKTIFLTTHNMHDADELCDRVAFIVEGELKLVGEPAALKIQHGQKTVEVTTSSRIDSSPSLRCFELATLGTNAEFVKLLNEEEIISIHSQEATLEEVFIKTTGATLL